MSPIAFLLFLFWLSFCFAKVEIAIEGPSGWAKNLPTWRLPEDHWVSRIPFGGRPATGYHVWVMTFIFSMLHIGYLFVAPSWSRELQVVAFFILFWLVEDFLWFVLNPAFGIKNFKKEKIWWHAKHWWVFAPRDYFIFPVVAFVLYFLSFRV